MAFENVEQQSPPQGRNLARVLKELQGKKVAVVAGSAANAPQAVAGIGLDDTIVAAIEVVDPGSVAGTAVLVDRTAVASIPSAGNVQFSAATNASGAGARVFVLWADKQGL